MVEVTVRLPDKLALAIGETPHVRARRVLEHIAIGEYCAGRVSHRQVGDVLGLDYWQTERFLTDRSVPQNCALDDLNADRAALGQILERR